VPGLSRLTSLFLTQLQRVGDYCPLGTVGPLATVGLTHMTVPDFVEPIQYRVELNSLNLNIGVVSDLGPLAAAFPNLSHLYLERTGVSDLRRLAGIRLTTLAIQGCPVLDVRPLAGKELTLYLSHDRDYDGIDELGPGVSILRW
jgi:hypothetical protein